ncbi:TetR/AcrR family transcriptional regulator [Roseobacter sinensis]|uniref:TetR/AcrR family transcriptional regulator n=1 Tax=Roseobacter sinensis TaxID=2931391 RepID=A0ABT3BE49_9RHOB|nr:TetR/AcrR family transcriptional regulator [Roseobacter sp. WL0113]MCV3271830.1 TetR/AcrR family transcriptional regulator [Roseobacter sp. WL0113]
MTKPVQKRTLITRRNLIAAAQEIIAAKGYQDMRIDEVVQKAGVAKGTFFAHFPDKDALMDLMIGARIDAELDKLAQQDAPTSVGELVTHLRPLLGFMTQERYVFDVILRHSGAAAREEIGPIAKTFSRQISVIADWLADGPFRKDISPHLLADGVQAFAIQAMGLQFCAIHNGEPMITRLETYLDAWLTPGGAAA